jgi:hypothetical protein
MEDFWVGLHRSPNGGDEWFAPSPCSLLRLRLILPPPCSPFGKKPAKRDRWRETRPCCDVK